MDVNHRGRGDSGYCTDHSVELSTSCRISLSQLARVKRQAEWHAFSRYGTPGVTRAASLPPCHSPLCTFEPCLLDYETSKEVAINGAPWNVIRQFHAKLDECAPNVPCQLPALLVRVRWYVNVKVVQIWRAWQNLLSLAQLLKFVAVHMVTFCPRFEFR